MPPSTAVFQLLMDATQARNASGQSATLQLRWQHSLVSRLGVPRSVSGFGRQEFAVGTTPSLADVSDWQLAQPWPGRSLDMGLGGDEAHTVHGVVAFDNLALQHGSRYYILARTTSGAGLAAVASRSFLVDRLPPAFSSVAPARSPACNFTFSGAQSTVPSPVLPGVEFCQSASSIVSVAWCPLSSLSGVRRQSIALGSRALESNLAGWTDLSGGTTTFAWSNLSLSSGSVVFVSLRAESEAGTVGSFSSPALWISSQPPAVSAAQSLWIGESAPQAFIAGDAIVAQWPGVFSGAHTVEWAIGTSPAGQQLLAWTQQHLQQQADGSGLPTKAVISGLQLQSGVSYHVSVRARTCSGLISEVRSVSVLCDAAPPLGGEVSIVEPIEVRGAGSQRMRLNATATRFVAADARSLRVRWCCFYAGASPIESYRVQLFASDSAANGTWAALPSVPAAIFNASVQSAFLSLMAPTDLLQHGRIYKLEGETHCCACKTQRPECPRLFAASHARVLFASLRAV